MKGQGCSNHADDESTALIGSNSPKPIYSSIPSIRIDATEAEAETQTATAAASGRRDRACAAPHNSTLRLSCVALPDTIDNKGSVARDLCAAERNYLSWLRLSLVFMSTGAAALDGIDQLRRHFPSEETDSHRFYYWLMELVERYNRPIGLSLFFLAMTVVFSSTAVYYHMCAQLAASKQPLRWPGILLLGVTIAVLAASLIIAIVTLRR